MVDERTRYRFCGCGWCPPQCISTISALILRLGAAGLVAFDYRKISIKSFISIKNFLTHEWHIYRLSVKGSSDI